MNMTTVTLVIKIATKFCTRMATNEMIQQTGFKMVLLANNESSSEPVHSFRVYSPAFLLLVHTQDGTDQRLYHKSHLEAAIYMIKE